MSKIYRIDCRPIKEDNTWRYEILSIEGEEKECLMSVRGFQTYEVADQHASEMLNDYILEREKTGEVIVSIKEYKSLKMNLGRMYMIWLLTFILLVACIIILISYKIK